MRTIKATFATILVPGSACILVPYFILKAANVSLNPPIGIIQIIALLAAVLGWGMIIWVSTAFVRLGKGTPIPIEPPRHLVISGLYRYMRNPMYTGALIIILAEALYFRATSLVFYAIGLGVLFQTFLIIFEEPQLKRRFGMEYKQYLETVPRWIPKLRRRNK
jgi:protein-S-isoprenylcysteine O-methyltransferase Ste14